ncbi:hypothetical protein M427DRAFT_65036 [Gonapodya prolifera JEL478]|uniref:Rab-GAP TBC domain-containing protein n=1 Tax=Gonapodya prolifera (strain JEL478) TaxID=1344416 RepID=A0A138ZWT3_GONPJ|nr:hypothetical protein M427DRAFT_65036 [Gonapodya prolifera JEL478]|eukprot:KXS08921.1 hypothetical protein M427DRAFT_65036 [Gonapodya prolifera JEL478]
MAVLTGSPGDKRPEQSPSAIKIESGLTVPSMGAGAGLGQQSGTGVKGNSHTHRRTHSHSHSLGPLGHSPSTRNTFNTSGYSAMSVSPTQSSTQTQSHSKHSINIPTRPLTPSPPPLVAFIFKNPSHVDTFGLRSIAWLLFLLILPPISPSSSVPDLDLWLASLLSLRSRYATLKQSLSKLPSSSSPASFPSDPSPTASAVPDPLSLSPSSPWIQYFADETLRGTISVDVARTFPDLSFFHPPSTADSTTDTPSTTSPPQSPPGGPEPRLDWAAICNSVLFVHARLNPSVSYRQGMHELAAVVLFALARERGYDDEARLVPGFAASPASFSDSSTVSRTLSSNKRSKASPSRSWTKPLTLSRNSPKSSPPGSPTSPTSPPSPKSPTSPVAPATLALDKHHFLSTLCSSSPADLEADIYVIFASIMSRLSPLYEHEDPGPVALSSSTSTSPTGQASQARSLARKPPLVWVCKGVQEEMLRWEEPEMEAKMKEAGVEGQVWGIRFLRLLFSREFPLPQLLDLWDALLASDPGFRLPISALDPPLWSAEDNTGEMETKLVKDKDAWTGWNVADAGMVEWTAVAVASEAREKVLAPDSPHAALTALLRFVDPAPHLSPGRLASLAWGMRSRYEAGDRGDPRRGKNWERSGSVTGLVRASTEDEMEGEGWTDLGDGRTMALAGKVPGAWVSGNKATKALGSAGSNSENPPARSQNIPTTPPVSTFQMGIPLPLPTSLADVQSAIAGAVQGLGLGRLGVEPKARHPAPYEHRGWDKMQATGGSGVKPWIGVGAGPTMGTGARSNAVDVESARQDGSNEEKHTSGQGLYVAMAGRMVGPAMEDAQANSSISSSPSNRVAAVLEDVDSVLTSILGLAPMGKISVEQWKRAWEEATVRLKEAQRLLVEAKRAAAVAGDGRAENLGVGTQGAPDKINNGSSHGVETAVVRMVDIEDVLKEDEDQVDIGDRSTQPVDAVFEATDSGVSPHSPLHRVPIEPMQRDFSHPIRRETSSTPAPLGELMSDARSALAKLPRFVGNVAERARLAVEGVTDDGTGSVGERGKGDSAFASTGSNLGGKFVMKKSGTLTGTVDGVRIADPLGAFGGDE